MCSESMPSGRQNTQECLTYPASELVNYKPIEACLHFNLVRRQGPTPSGQQLGTPFLLSLTICCPSVILLSTPSPRSLIHDNGNYCLVSVLHHIRKSCPMFTPSQASFLQAMSQHESTNKRLEKETLT